MKVITLVKTIKMKGHSIESRVEKHGFNLRKFTFAR